MSSKFLIGLIFILLSGFCLNGKADNLNWNELEQFSNYKLVVEIRLSPELVLKVGSIFFLEETVAGEIPAILLVFHNNACDDNSLSSDLVLFNPNPNDPSDDWSVGVTWEENCKVSLYLEPRHFFTESLFQEGVYKTGRFKRSLK